MKTSTTLLIALVMAATPVIKPAPAAQSEEDRPFRKISIPEREHGYQFLETRMIRTQKELNALLKKQEGERNNRKAFKEGLKKAKVDFEKEVLILITHTETSGSNIVTFEKPSKDGITLECRIIRKPAEFGTEDMAYYCFALAVRKSLIGKVEIWRDKNLIILFIAPLILK